MGQGMSTSGKWKVIGGGASPIVANQLVGLKPRSDMRSVRVQGSNGRTERGRAFFLRDPDLQHESDLLATLTGTALRGPCP